MTKLDVLMERFKYTRKFLCRNYARDEVKYSVMSDEELKELGISKWLDDRCFKEHGEISRQEFGNFQSLFKLLTGKVFPDDLNYLFFIDEYASQNVNDLLDEQIANIVDIENNQIEGGKDYTKIAESMEEYLDIYNRFRCSDEKIKQVREIFEKIINEE